jgi:transcriptional regulator with XRE-family HTH domain
MAETLGEILRQAIAERGYSLAGLAKRIGRSVQHVSQVVHGQNNPSFESMRLFAAALDISLDEVHRRLAPVQLADPDAPMRGKGRPSIERKPRPKPPTLAELDNGG